MSEWHKEGVLTVEVGPENGLWRTNRGKRVPDALVPYLWGVCEVHVHFVSEGYWEPPRSPNGVQRESSAIEEDVRTVAFLRVVGEKHVSYVNRPETLEAVAEAWEDEIYEVEL
jgi:hypothetical protein